MGYDYVKIAVLSCRLCLCISLIYSGYDMAMISGESNYNKYLHAVRKMAMPKTNPGD